MITTPRTIAALMILPLALTAPIQADPSLAGRTIAIDAGHGTVDFQGHVINSGKATRNKRAVEHRLTFDMAQKLGELIVEQGGQVIYTRSPLDYWRYATSTFEDNKARALLANVLKADAFVSIHCDWNPRQKMKGVTTYYKTPQSFKLAQEVQKKLVRELKTFDRRTKRDSYTVLDVAEMPAILVETGFLSNSVEAKKLISKDYQKKVAEAICSGLRSALADQPGN